jgi:hypothetical protein
VSPGRSVRIARVVALLFLIVGALAVACSAFDSADDEQGGTDAGGDGAMTDGGPAAETSVADADADGAKDAGKQDGSCGPSVPPSSGCTTSGMCGPSAVSNAVLVDGGYAVEERHVFGIAATTKHVYWAAQSAYNGSSNGFILRVSKAGGVRDKVAAVFNPLQVTAAYGYVYWLSRATQSSVWRVPDACSPPACTPELVHQRQAGDPIVNFAVVAPDEVIVHANFKLVRVRLQQTTWVADPELAVGSNGDVHGADVGIFFASSPSREVKRVTFSSTGGMTTLHTTMPGDAGVRLLTSACGSLYALATVNGAADALYDVTALNGPPKSVSIGVDTNVFALASDARFIYFGVPDIGGIYRVERSGGLPKKLAEANVFALAVDDDAIYYADHAGTDGRIQKLTK